MLKPVKVGEGIEAVQIDGEGVLIKWGNAITYVANRHIMGDRVCGLGEFPRTPKPNPVRVDARPLDEIEADNALGDVAATDA